MGMLHKPCQLKIDTIESINKKDNPKKNVRNASSPDFRYTDNGEGMCAKSAYLQEKYDHFVVYFLPIMLMHRIYSAP